MYHPSIDSRIISVPRLVLVPVRNNLVFIRRYVSAYRLVFVDSSFLLRHRLLAHCRLIMSLDPEPNDSLLEAYTALVSFLNGNDDLRTILKGIPAETSSWPSSDDIFTPLLLNVANILHCRPRNTLTNQTIIRKLFIKVHPDKLTSCISINGKHAALFIYSFRTRLKDPYHNLNLPRLYPCIITGFTTNNMQLPTRFEFDALVLSSQIPSDDPHRLLDRSQLGATAELHCYLDDSELFQGKTRFLCRNEDQVILISPRHLLGLTPQIATLHLTATRKVLVIVPDTINDGSNH